MTTDPADLQLIGPTQVAGLRARFDADEAYAKQSGQHLWVAIQTHVVSADTLDASLRGEPPMFDRESLRDLNVGCYVCEQAWTPQLTRRRCPGEPRP